MPRPAAVSPRPPFALIPPHAVARHAQQHAAAPAEGQPPAVLARAARAWGHQAHEESQVACHAEVVARVFLEEVVGIRVPPQAVQEDVGRHPGTQPQRAVYHQVVRLALARWGVDGRGTAALIAHQGHRRLYVRVVRVWGRVAAVAVNAYHQLRRHAQRRLLARVASPRLVVHRACLDQHGHGPAAQFVQQALLTCRAVLRGRRHGVCHLAANAAAVTHLPVHVPHHPHVKVLPCLLPVSGVVLQLGRQVPKALGRRAVPAVYGPLRHVVEPWAQRRHRAAAVQRTLYHRVVTFRAHRQDQLVVNLLHVKRRAHVLNGLRGQRRCRHRHAVPRRQSRRAAHQGRPSRLALPHRVP